jgi:SAM-dependent methyltransferase
MSDASRKIASRKTAPKSDSPKRGVPKKDAPKNDAPQNDAYQEETYGERIAGIYDEWYGSYDEAAIDCLARLARGGLALELGIGTGRIALPLQERGVQIHGIDASESMVARLRLKPGGDRIPVAFGSFADVAVEGQFSLVYVPFNTFFALLTQEEQVRCFRNVARHLLPGGVFVIEAFLPDLTRFVSRQTVRAISIETGELRLDASQVDPVSQVITSQHILLTGQGVRLFPVKLRYVWPAEMDLMAAAAGMRLQHRWGTWQGAPFTADSGKHISVYELAQG